MRTDRKLALTTAVMVMTGLAACSGRQADNTSINSDSIYGKIETTGARLDNIGTAIGELHATSTAFWATYTRELPTALAQQTKIVSTERAAARRATETARP